MSGRRVLVRSLLIALAALGVQFTVSGSAAADPPVSSWARLRMCESSGNYAIVASNGHYGAYQFDLSTWRSVGGAGYPHRASPREQDYRALYLYRMRGWQPWTCARRLGLREDAERPQQARADAGPSPPTSAVAVRRPAPPSGGMPAVARRGLRLRRLRRARCGPSSCG